MTDKAKFALAIILGFILPMILLVVAGIHATGVYYG